jgi:hypothetical protein
MPEQLIGVFNVRWVMIPSYCLRLSHLFDGF